VFSRFEHVLLRTRNFILSVALKQRLSVTEVACVEIHGRT